MTLKTAVTCIEIHKKSQSPAFKDLKNGDVIEFSVEIKRVGRNRGTYATYIRCFNPQTDQISNLSFNQIVKTLDCFEFKEKDLNYENILDKIEAKEPEVFYASGHWNLYKEGYMDAKREISNVLNEYFG